MSYSIDHYLVFKGDVAKEFCGGYCVAQALEHAIVVDADKVWHYVSDEDTHRDISGDLATDWFNRYFAETKEVPAILPDFIKSHLPAETIKEKLKQQLEAAE